MANLLTTYALLAYLKETSHSNSSITELYVPLVKKALADYSFENGLQEYKGQSLGEISDKIKSIFEIEIPIPILSKIMTYIKEEINNDEVFSLYNDGAFIIKSYVFSDINEYIEQENNNIQFLKKDFKSYCIQGGFNYDFNELRQFILSSQIDIFTNYQSNFIDVSYYIPKYIHERMDNHIIFKIMSSIYLGGIIASYLEQNITKRVADAELLLDTNFIISLIDLNTQDAYKTCNQLFLLCSQLGYRFTILNRTISQIKILLSNRINDYANKDFIGSVRGADVFNACIRRGLDKTDLERIKDNLSKIIEEKGIVVIYDVQIKDIIKKAEKTNDYKDLLERRNFNKESALNDTIAKLYVEQKRGFHVREFVDVKCWFLHNSYSSYEYSIGSKIHERYSISANELLVLLWLSSPAQGNNIKISDIARSGLTAYVTKYRRAKAPSHEVLKNIKKRIDEASKLGIISETDTFNLCIRMSEGNLSHVEITESLTGLSVTNEQFANKLKEYSLKIVELEKKQKQEFNVVISEFQHKLEDRDNVIQNLQQQIEKIEKRDYERSKESYIIREVKRCRKYAFFYFVFILILLVFWFINHNNLVIEEPWASIIAIFVFISSSIIMRFINHTTVQEFFNQSKLRNRLELEFIEKEKK